MNVKKSIIKKKKKKGGNIKRLSREGRRGVRKCEQKGYR